MASEFTRKNDHSHNQHLAKKIAVCVRVNSDLKNEVDDVLSRLGLTMSDAISLYLSQIKLNEGIPFDIKIPNKVTARAIREARAKKGVVACKNAKEMFKKLGM
jgi:DNA-damage-inducible protein J